MNEITLSVIVPLYNEIENVPNLCKAINDAVSKIGCTYEILIIDDGSSDGSWEKLKECAKQYKNFRLIRFRRNFGQTAAMSAGFRESKGKIVVTLDADLQNDPTDIKMLVDKMNEGYDVVSGWRKNRKDTFINRKLPSMLANGMISWITGVHLHDYGCTLKAYSREVVQNIDLYGEMHRFIPALASWGGGRTTEVVVNHHPRLLGKSKYGIGRVTKVILDLITVKFLLSYSTKPIQIFGKIGLYCGIPGILLFLFIFFSHFLWKFFDIGSENIALMAKSPFWLISSFMLIFFGIQFISMGVLAELQTRTYHEAQNKPIYVIKEIVE